MRKITLIIAVLTVLGQLSFAQFIGVPGETKKEVQNNNLILGFINPKNFSFSSSLNMSYNSFGGASYSIAAYTGTLNYKIMDNMNLSADITMQYAPYVKLGTGSIADNKNFQNYLNGINLSRLSFTWAPSKNFLFNISYFNNKSGYNYSGFNNYYFPRYLGY